MSDSYTIITYCGKPFAAFALADGSIVKVAAYKGDVSTRARQLAKDAIKAADRAARTRDRLLAVVAKLDAFGE